MIIIGIAVFLFGVMLGFVILDKEEQLPEQRPEPSSHHNRLDTVDDMVLWGEVTGDSDYRI